MAAEVCGRIAPILFLTGVGLVLVALDVLPDDLGVTERVLTGLGGAALVALSVRWYPHVRDRYR